MKIGLNKETGLILIAFVCALCVRIVGLSAQPMADFEASNALNALKIFTSSANGSIGHEPGYTLYTGLLMLMTGAGELSARLITAVLGSFIVLVPILFNRYLGRGPTIILAYLLAFDPGMVSISRGADGSSWAIFFFVLGLGMWINRRFKLMGLTIGLTLLGGVSLWIGVLGFGLAYLFFRLPNRDMSNTNEIPEPFDNNRRIHKTTIMWAAGSLILLGSLFFLKPAGLSAIGSSLAASLSTWFHTSTRPFIFPIAVLIFTQPLGLSAAIASLGYKKSPLIRFLIYWWVVALFLAFIYPADERIDLIWSILPMLALASIQINHLIQLSKEKSQAISILAFAVFALVVFGLLSLKAGLNNPANNPWVNWAGVIVSIILLVAVLALSWWGSSAQITKIGAAWGIIIASSLIVMSALFATSGIRKDTTQFFFDASEPGQTDLLLDTIRDVAEWNSGNRKTAEVVISGIKNPSMEWELRDYDLTITSGLGSQSSPQIVITDDLTKLALAAEYRGQDFAWQATPLWGQMEIQDWLKFLFIKSTPVQQNNVILWIRLDQFPAQ